MASAYLGSGMTAKPAASIGSIDDLPVFNTGTAFSEPAVLVPSPVRAATSKLMYVMIAAIVAFAAVAIVLLVLLLHRDPKSVAPPPVVAIVEPPPPPSPPVITPPPPAPVEVQHVPPPPPEPPANQPAPKLHPKAVALAQAPPPPKQAKSEAKKSDDCDDIFCVVNSDAACCKSRAPKAAPKQPPPPPPSPPRSDLPEQLTSSMITTAMNGVKARAMACGDKSPAKGRVLVHLKVSNDGHVSDVKVLASPDDALGACVTAAVNRATFPATQSGRSFSVPYTF
jgi:TonB family protein